MQPLYKKTNLMSFSFELELWKLFLKIWQPFFWKYPDTEGEELAVSDHIQWHYHTASFLGLPMVQLLIPYTLDSEKA